MRRALLLLIPLAAIGFALAGCGGSKESASTTTRAAGFSTVEATTTEPVTTQATTPKTTSNPTTTPTSTVASAKNCKGLADLGQKFSSAFTGAANAQDLKKEAQLLKEFADKTPADIRPDFQVLAQYMTKIADALEGVKLSGTPECGDAREASEALDRDRPGQAHRRLGAHLGLGAEELPRRERLARSGAASAAR